MQLCVGVLRFRPGSQDRQGLTQKELEEIISSYSVEGSPKLRVVSTDNFILPGSRFELDTQRRLDSTMASMIAAYDIVVVDQTYDLAEARDPLSDYPLHDAIMFALDSCADHSKSIIIVRTELPQPGDALYYLSTSSEYRVRVSVVASDGKPHIGQIEQGFADHIASELSDALSAQVDSSFPFLRRRGVFRLSKKASPYFMFHYDLETGRRDDLVAKLDGYLKERHASLVIYDSRHAAPWYDAVVGTVCDSAENDLARFDYAHGTKTFQPRTGGDSLAAICQRARIIWEDETKVVCFWFRLTIRVQLSTS